MRQVRRVPAAAKGLQRSRTRRPNRVRDGRPTPARGQGSAMTYTVKEIFYTLQGEGAQSGRAAVFCRFSGCNLWSGREEDRSRAVCQFCDTDFVGTGPDGGRFSSANELADAIDRCWGGVSPSLSRASSRPENGASSFAPARARRPGKKFVVCTGG